MRHLEVLPGLRLTRPLVEAAIERLVELGYLDVADSLLAMLDDADGDPDFEDHPLHGQHDGREPDDGDYEWDARDGDKPPVDPVTGLDVVQDEWKAYPEIWRTG